jgi:integrase/recombinase XerC
LEECLKVWSYSQSHRIEGKGQLIAKSDQFFESCEIQGLSPDTVRSYAFGLLSFFRWLKEDWKKFEGFTQKDLQDWMHHLKIQKLKPRSINQRLVCARAFYRFCFGKDLPHAAGVLYPKGYFKGPRRTGLGLHSARRKSFLELKVKVPHEVVDPLKPGDVDLFLSNLNRYRDLGIVLTMLLCGLRSQEIIQLRMEDVNFHQSSIKVRGKGKRERIVPMPYHLMQVLERYLEVERPLRQTSESFFVVLQGKRTGQILNRKAFRRFFRYHSLKLKMPKARPHQFRHAFASDLARAGVPLTTIQKLLGHADPKTSLIYIDLFLEDIRAEYDKAMKRIKERYAALSNEATSRSR